MRTIVAAAIMATAVASGADATSTCKDVARHLESGSVLLGDEPVQIVPHAVGVAC
jgi:hypothetical protein